MNPCGELLSVIHNPWVIWGFFLFLGTFLRAMPDPTAQSGLIYRWLYGMAHGLLSNWDEVGKALKPGAKQ
jgi:hypothetical protein